MKATIRPLESNEYPAFFSYLNAQLEENGKNGNPLFHPVSRAINTFPQEKEAAFVSGLSKTVCQSGWRRAWVICNEAGHIMGHVDLRAHSDSTIHHRALLGMGVGMDYRRQGLGRELLEFACDWVRHHAELEWIDIEVLAENEPAVQLYRNAGFEWMCDIPDLYRIDDQPQTVTRMARKL